jgi:uncharacterized delta-60 repeat protein
MSKLATTIPVVFLATLLGCGGGDESGDLPPSSETPPPQTPPSPPPPPPPPPPPETEPPPPGPPIEVVGTPYRLWGFIARNGNGVPMQTEIGEQSEGEVYDVHDFGRLTLAISGQDLRANGEVYSSESGITYWVEAEAPVGNVNLPAEITGSLVLLNQAQRYRKLAADATLTLVITEAKIEGIDFNGNNSLGAHCPWMASVSSDVRCFDRVIGELKMDVQLDSGNQRLARYVGGGVLQGWQNSWVSFAFTEQDDPSVRSIFGANDYTMEMISSSGGLGFVGARWTTTRDVPIHVDLSAVPVGAEFLLWSDIRVTADNRRGRESYIGGRLRDPANLSGTRVEATGVEALPTPAGLTRAENPTDSMQCSAAGTAPEAGRVQFSTHQYFEPEFGNQPSSILVTRTGGTSGVVIAHVRTLDDTALAGVHYQPVNKRIAFPDGDDTPRAIPLRVIDDTIPHGDRRVMLEITAEEGCATIGSQDTAALTIIDDDVVNIAPTYSVGGTVSGVQGTGLVIREVRSGNDLTPGNGSFTFPYDFSDEDEYEVRIEAQPTNPTQICHVERGSGEIEGGNVTDVAVRCETPAANTQLDTGFGDGGRVTAGLPGEGRAVALQTDGKVVVLGKSTLARFNTDGSLDASFGTAGNVAVSFSNVFGEEAVDLGVQSDGRIVVGGFTRASATVLNYDFAAVRFNIDGSIDTSFGNNGVVVIDFDGQVDKAERLLVQDDGKIILAGYAGFAEPANSGGFNLRTSFGIARLNADGSLDTGFAGDGTTKAFGGSSFGHAVAVGPDGKVLMAGRIANEGADEPWSALVRWHSDGTGDTNEDDDPDSYLGVDGSSRGADELIGGGERIKDLFIDEDGRVFGVMTAGDIRGSLLFAELIIPFGEAAGQPPRIRLTTVDLGPGDDDGDRIVRDADGKFIVVGSASTATTTDFGLVRFNPDRTVDTTFGTDGVHTIDFFGGTDGANDAVMQPDGKIVIVGIAWNGSGYGFAMTRVLP